MIDLWARVHAWLFTGRLRMVPEIRPDGRFYRWTGQASYGRLLAGLIGVQGLVPPGGNARQPHS
jgi:hypothetical protein